MVGLWKWFLLNALLRFTLGSEYLKAGDPAKALVHLGAAVAQEPTYSAAWKLLGKAHAEKGDAEGAMQAYRRGIEAARLKGDKQAAREMEVFIRRLEIPGPSRAGP